MGRRRSPPEPVLADSTNIEHEQAAATKHDVPRGEGAGLPFKNSSMTFSRKGKVLSRASRSSCVSLLKLTQGIVLRHFGMAVLENVDNRNSAGSAAAGQVRARE